MNTRPSLIRASVMLALYSYLPSAVADSHTQGVRGGVGLIQTPTARMADYGDFSTNYVDMDEYRFWSASIQLLPWLESTVRYTDVRTQLYSPFESFSGDQTLKDKGIDVKFNLLNESYYLPQIAFGLTDIGGTGFFSSEFLVASKQIHDFDLHLGIGTGYLGRAGNIDNPLCELKDSFCTRPDGFQGLGGKIDYKEFFKGNMSVFGGIQYRTPIPGLSLSIELDGNDYLSDRAGTLRQDSRINIGANYQYKNWDFSLSYQRGNTLGFGLSYRINFNDVKQTQFDAAPRDPRKHSQAKSIDDLNRNALFNSIVREGKFLLSDVDYDGQRYRFYGRQLGYRDNKIAAERVGRIIASALPNDVDEFSVVDIVGDRPMVETIYDRDAFYRSINVELDAGPIDSTYKRVSPEPKTLTAYQTQAKSGFYIGAEAFWIQTFGSPEAFYLFQGGAIVNAGYQLSSNIGFNTATKVTVVENFDQFNYLVDNQASSLPRVRTRVREYVSGKRVTLENAFFRWHEQIAENNFVQVYAGHLESMFGGIGAEWLYRPVDSGLAYGIDINVVKQRSPQSEIAFDDYSVVTGHASVYWRPAKFDDLQVTAQVGRFLAGDHGINLDVAKKFDTGIIVGGYAAFTNVSAEDYGEGSFTKGFYISIPFDLFSFAPAKGRGKIPWVPIGRDGGQMLRRPARLKDMTEIRDPFYD